MKKSSANAPEPAPIKNEREPCWDYLLRCHSCEVIDNPQLREDIIERDAEGVRKYGTKLQPFNGRNPDVDMYQEILDAVVYCAQCLQEAEAGHPERGKREWLYRTLLSSLLGHARVMSVVARASKR